MGINADVSGKEEFFPDNQLSRSGIPKGFHATDPKYNGTLVYRLIYKCDFNLWSRSLVEMFHPPRSNPPHQSEWSSDMICVLLEAPGAISGVPQSFSYVRGTPDLSPQLAHSHTPSQKPVGDRVLINVFAFSTIPLCMCDLYTQRMTCTLTETLSLSVCLSHRGTHTHIHC